MNRDDLRAQMIAHLERFQEMGIEQVDIEETGSVERLGKAEELQELWKSRVDGCTRCKLAQCGRHNIVFGDGNANADLMFIGEGPGEDEDKQGLPFVGRAGQKLNEIIRAMGLERGDVYIANIVKCRPPGNRAPETDEVESCFPYLLEQISIISPKVIVALGGTASHNLLNVDTPISKMRGNFYHLAGVPVMPTYHPAYLLRNYTPKTRKEVWDDMQKVLEILRRETV